MKSTPPSACTTHIVLGLFVVAAFIGAQQVRADAAGDEESARVEKLIEQLGSAFFDEREAAATELRKIGTRACEKLADARNHPSAEVRSRATALLRQLHVFPLRDAFQAFAKQADEQLDLEEGMFLISRILNNDVRREALTKQLDQLAAAVRKKLGEGVVPKSVEPERMVTVLREVLFDDEKLGGNFDDYQNPANSSLEKVLQTRKGLPILVSHVVIAVGRRLEIPIVGLPTAGRYIVKYDGSRAPPGSTQSDIFFDPFDNGRVLTREMRAELFPGTDPERLVEAQSKRKDLIRMLNNLETHLFNRDEISPAYLAVEFRVALEQNPIQVE